MKLTKDELDYATHTQSQDALANRIPAGVDQQGHLNPRPYKPSEHVDPSWSGQGGDTEDPPPKKGDGWRIVALALLSAGVVAAVLLLVRWALS